MQVRDHLQEAIQIAGSEAKLGKATGYSQNAIWQAKERGTVTPLMAVKIEAATEGQVLKEKLCPDVFAPEATS